MFLKKQFQHVQTARNATCLPPLCSYCLLVPIARPSKFPNESSDKPCAPSESLQTVVRPDIGSTVTVSTELPLCAVCKISGVNDTEKSCHSSLPLVPDEEVKLLFNCSQPVDQAFTVLITRTIGEAAKLEAFHFSKSSRGPNNLKELIFIFACFWTPTRVHQRCLHPDNSGSSALLLHRLFQNLHLGA